MPLVGGGRRCLGVRWEAARVEALKEAAEERCASCSVGLLGKITNHFNANGKFYCSTACVRAARTAGS